MKKFWIVCVALWVITLTGCDTFTQVPPEDAVRIAVIQQLTKVHNAISKDLGLPAPEQPNFKVEKLTVSSREKLSDPAFEAKGYPSDIYRVSGTVETTLTTESGKTQQAGPFDIYLGTTPSEPSAKSLETERSKKENPEAERPETEVWYLIPAPQV